MVQTALDFSSDGVELASSGLCLSVWTEVSADKPID